MLIITRKIGERIVLEIGGERVEVVVVAVTRGKARIGIDAPLTIEIWREEIYEKATKVTP